LPTLIPVGRPYLQAQYDRKKCGQSTETKEKSVRILLGTQNIDDDVRREFTEVTLAGIQETEQKVSVVIKPHPDESPEFYEDLLQSDEIPDVDVSLSSGDLEEQINRSDLLVTIRSNVGLESIILGTPSISINLRKPNYPDYLYASEGPVPSFSTREEVRSFFSSLSGETLHTLQQREESWVMENYTLEQNGAKEIARIIESEAKE
jgi:CDP-glycerol glycerophosphotransferase (TagB/SpsB family)